MFTVPLTYQDRGVIGKGLSLLGQKNLNCRDNHARKRFNYFLKGFHGADRCFDLALLESTQPNGHRLCATVTNIPRRCPEYTYDGGHLNQEGKLHLATTLIEKISTILTKTKESA